MINQEIIKYIEKVLSEGIFSEKERDMLYIKAVESGIDKKDIELYLQEKTNRIHTQNNNIRKCPGCGSSIPVLSKICSFCNYNFSHFSKPENSIDDLIEKISENIAELKSVPKNNLFTFFCEYKFIIIPAFAIILFSYAIRTGTSDLGYMFMILSVILGILSAILIYQKFLKKNNVAGKVQTFENIKASFEKYKLLTQTYYGKDINISNLLKKLNNEVKKTEEIRQKNKKVNTRICVGIFLVLILLYFLVPKA